MLTTNVHCFSSCQIVQKLTSKAIHDWMIVPRSVQVSGHISLPPSPQYTRTHTALISTDLHSYPTTNYRSKRFISKSINLWTNCRDLSETWMRTILPTRTVHARSVLKYSSFKFALSKLTYIFRGQWQLDIMWTIYKHNKFCVAIVYISLSILHIYLTVWK